MKGIVNVKICNYHINFKMQLNVHIAHYANFPKEKKFTCQIGNFVFQENLIVCSMCLKMLNVKIMATW